MATITLKQKEAKKLKFESLQNEIPVDLSDANVFFGVKQKKEDTVYLIYKDDKEFDKSKAITGHVAEYFLVQLILVFDPGNIWRVKD